MGQQLGPDGLMPRFCPISNRARPSWDEERPSRTSSLLVETCAAAHPMYECFLKAGEQAGHIRVEDHNAFRQEGVHVTQRNVGRGLRWSTSRGYLHEGPSKPTLDVIVRARVSRIEIVGKRAVHVHLSHNGSAYAVEAVREVVLCAGALNSPQLLMLSGVGNAQQLGKLGIKSTADLPGVGLGLKDHTAAAIQYTITRNVLRTNDLEVIWTWASRCAVAAHQDGPGAPISSKSVPSSESAILNKFRISDSVPASSGELQHGAVELDDGLILYQPDASQEQRPGVDDSAIRMSLRASCLITSRIRTIASN